LSLDDVDADLLSDFSDDELEDSEFADDPFDDVDAEEDDELLAASRLSVR